MGQAQTGSGKTAAFLLPIIQKIYLIKAQQRYNQVNTDSPLAIIISPARELTQQLFNDANRLTFSKKFFKILLVIIFIFLKTLKKNFFFYFRKFLDTNITVNLCIGETPMPTELNGCDIVVATMGRLKHLIELKIVYLFLYI